MCIFGKYHRKIDIFTGLIFLQETMKYSSTVNTFYCIIKSTQANATFDSTLAIPSLVAIMIATN